MERFFFEVMWSNPRRVWNLRFGIWDLREVVCVNYLRFGIWDLRVAIWDLRFTILDLRFWIYGKLIVVKLCGSGLREILSG
jgi:hypothetical protein